MAPRCGCGSSATCSCRILAGTGATVSGTGSVGNPYVIGASGGDGAFYFEMTDAEFFDAIDNATLVPGSWILYTEGPTIGTAGNTSPTQILVQATSTSDVTTNVTVFTEFSYGGWLGVYDLVVTGKFSELRDHLGNVVIDIKQANNLIIDQFPWGYNNVYGNTITQADPAVDGTYLALTGWGVAAAAGTVIAHNTVTEVGSVGSNETIVDLSGLVGTGQKFKHNQITGSQLRLTTTLPNNASLTNNAVTGGFRALFAPTTCPSLTVAGCEFYNHFGANQDDFKFIATSTTLDLESVKFEGTPSSYGTLYSFNGAGGDIIMQSSELARGSSISRLAATNMDFITRGARIISTSLQADGNDSNGGDISLLNCYLTGWNIALDVASQGGVNVVNSTLNSGSAGQSAATTQSLFIDNSTVIDGTFNQTGTEGQIGIFSSSITGSTLETTGTNELRLVDSTVTGSTISQQRTNGPNYDRFSSCTFSNCVVTLTGAAGPTGSTSTAVEVTSGGVLTVDDPGGSGTFLQNTSVTTGAHLVIQAGGSVLKSRIAGGGTLNTGAFAHTGLAVEKSTTTTLTAANTNTYAGFGVTTLV